VVPILWAADDPTTPCDMTARNREFEDTGSEASEGREKEIREGNLLSQSYTVTPSTGVRRKPINSTEPPSQNHNFHLFPCIYPWKNGTSPAGSQNLVVTFLKNWVHHHVRSGAAPERIVVLFFPRITDKSFKIFKNYDQPLGQPRFRSSNARVDFRFMSVPSVIVMSLFV
jgi:hypothetical protein